MILKKINEAGFRMFMRIKSDFGDNRGIGTVEVILILVVLIGLVVIFRNQLTTIINDIFGRIATDAAGI